MKRQVKRWLSVMMVALLAFVNMGAVMVEPVPMEEAEKDSLVEFRNNSLLCDTGCGGYYMQQGEAVLARGPDRTEDVYKRQGRDHAQEADGPHRYGRYDPRHRGLCVHRSLRLYRSSGSPRYPYDP